MYKKEGKIEIPSWYVEYYCLYILISPTDVDTPDSPPVSPVVSTTVSTTDYPPVSTTDYPPVSPPVSTDSPPVSPPNRNKDTLFTSIFFNIPLLSFSLYKLLSVPTITGGSVPSHTTIKLHNVPYHKQRNNRTQKNHHNHYTPQ